jgi:hypothetical protein
MIPVRMCDKNIGVYSAFLFKIIRHKPFAKLADTCPKINNDQPVIRPYFDTGCVSAVNYSIRARTWY